MRRGLKNLNKVEAHFFSFSDYKKTNYQFMRQYKRREKVFREYQNFLINAVDILKSIALMLPLPLRNAAEKLQVFGGDVSKTSS